MSRKSRVLCALFLFLLISVGADAKPIVKCDIKEVSKHPLLVTLEWRVSIFSDKAWDGCDLRISFQDNKGQEVYFVKEILKLKVGQNEFSGEDICNRDVWKRVAKYVTTLDCQF